MPRITPQIVPEPAPPKTTSQAKKPVKRPVKNNQRADRGNNRKRGNDSKLTAKEKRDKVAKQLKISDKTQNFYDEVITNPKIKKREAYKKHISDSTSDMQASVNASRLINSDKYQIYKDSAVSKAKKRIVSLVDSDNESIALKASQDIVDRTEGKAQQKDGDVSRTVKVEIDLTGVKLGNHYLTPQQIDGGV